MDYEKLIRTALKQCAQWDHTCFCLSNDSACDKAARAVYIALEPFLTKHN